MKKPQTIKGEYIPRKRNIQIKRQQPNKDSSIDVKDMLGKLDGNKLQQIATDLISGAVDVANNTLAYGQELEKTKQEYAKSHADIKKYESKVARTKEEELTKREINKTEAEKNHNDHIESMQKEKNSHITIMSILKQVEDGSISSEDLTTLISTMKQ